MTVLSYDQLASYWSPAEISTNLIIFMNLLGALTLGLCVGYERSYHGRAAGMRTYALVCTASCALTVIAGYPAFWFGGHSPFATATVMAPDPTRIIQGIVTGIGFLGAGVIMKEGFSISGLTTAASIWAASAIGIMVGLGFYAASILLTALAAFCMIWVSTLERWLPSRQAVAITLVFSSSYEPLEASLREGARKRGYDIAWGSLRIEQTQGRTTWHFVAVARNKRVGASVPTLAAELSKFEGVESFSLSHARN